MLVEEKFTNVGSFISLSSIGIGHCSAFRSYLHNGLGKEQERFNSRAFSLAVLHSVSLRIRRSVSHSRSHLSMQFIFPGSLILKLSSILTREFQSSFIGKRRNRKLGFWQGGRFACQKQTLSNWWILFNFSQKIAVTKFQNYLQIWLGYPEITAEIHWDPDTGNCWC